MITETSTAERTRAHAKSKSTGGIVELFAGVGSVARSFERSAGATPILSDIDGVAHDTCLENWPDVNYVLRDARDLRAADILDAADGRPVVGLLGCPPCQGFRSSGSGCSSCARGSPPSRSPATCGSGKLAEAAWYRLAGWRAAAG